MQFRDRRWWRDLVPYTILRNPLATHPETPANTARSRASGPVSFFRIFASQFSKLVSVEDEDVFEDKNINKFIFEVI